MYRLSPQLLIAAAGTMVSMGDDAIRLFTDVPVVKEDTPHDNPNVSWDAKFIERCGYWSHYDYRIKASSWPFPRGLSLNELALYAKANDVVTVTPEWGDIFLQYSSREKGYVHAGIVLEEKAAGKYSRNRSYVECYTVEGDTNVDAARFGGCIMRVVRRLMPTGGDRFIRWTSLPARHAPAGDAYVASLPDARKAS